MAAGPSRRAGAKSTSTAKTAKAAKAVKAVKASELPKPNFFKSGAELAAWLDTHGATASELFIGFYKTKSAKKGITYKEAIEEALCAGWVDGVVRTLDADSFMLRFSPRAAKSNWSTVNIARAEELKRQGRMKPPGLAAYEQRAPKKKGRYSYENQPKALDAASIALFKQHPNAWKFFTAQRPSYQRTVAWWVLDAAKEETRAKRLKTLIEDCENGRWIKGFISPKPKHPNPKTKTKNEDEGEG